MIYCELLNEDVKDCPLNWDCIYAWACVEE